REAEPVIEVERRGREDRRDLDRRHLHEDGESIEEADAEQDQARELCIHLERGARRRAIDGVEGEDQTRERAREELAVTAAMRVGVVEVGHVRRGGVEVIAVLYATDAGTAVRVAHREEWRLPVETLYRQKRAHRAAPPALAF